MAIGKIIAFMVALGIAYYGGYSRKDAIWTAYFEKYKAESIKLYSDSLYGVLVREREEKARADDIEQAYIEASKATDSLRSDNERLLNESRRMRQSTASSGTMGTNKNIPPSVPVNGVARGGISEEDARFLFGEAERADRLADYAHSCQEYIKGLR